MSLYYNDTKEQAMKLKIMVDEGCEIPAYAHEGDAGLDLRITEDVWLDPGERRTIPTGVRVAIPDGYVGLCYPRSGLATKQGITLSNCVGVIDSGYRGIIHAALINLSDKKQLLHKGERVCQLVVMKYEKCELNVVDELDDTARGEGGFGSSGKF